MREKRGEEPEKLHLDCKFTTFKPKSQRPKITGEIQQIQHERFNMKRFSIQLHIRKRKKLKIYGRRRHSRESTRSPAGGLAERLPGPSHVWVAGHHLRLTQAVEARRLARRPVVEVPGIMRPQSKCKSRHLLRRRRIRSELPERNIRTRRAGWARGRGRTCRGSTATPCCWSRSTCSAAGSPP